MRRVFFLIALLAASGAQATEVEFQHAAPGAGSVFVAGSFNGWDQAAHQLLDADGDGVFALALNLDRGTWQYKYIVDGVWTGDPHAPETTDDGFGGQNGVFVLGADKVVIGPAASGERASLGGDHEVGFSFEPKTAGVRDVFLAGSFNDWNATASPMTDDDGDGVWELTLRLPAGDHQYKFVVDGNWLADEHAADFADDGLDGQNSVVHVGAADDDDAALRRVTFRWAGRAQAVFLAGSFNDWASDKTPMRQVDDAWQLDLLLPPGECQYKFVADGNWLTDDGADGFVDDGFGGRNSVLRVDNRFPAVRRERGDGSLESGAIDFRPTFPDLNRVAPHSLEFNLRSAAGDLDDVELLLSHGGRSRAMPMRPVSSDGISESWRAEVDIRRPGEAISFHFLLRDGQTRAILDESGLTDESRAPRRFSVRPDDLDAFFTPDWVRDGVIYQIFPDRFHNGNPDNDPDFSEEMYDGARDLPPSGHTHDEYFHMVDDWREASGLARSPYRRDGRPDYFSFYGGDMEGVREKLDYLVDLGVTIIYFNPVTIGKSNHKYDAADYLRVDPHFGGNEAFRALVDAAHERGIRIVVEAVLNHSGDTHWAFVDSKKKGPESDYWTWYEWKKWPLPAGGPARAIDYYDCWWGFGLHPNLNFDLSRDNAAENNVRDINQADVNWPVVNHFIDDFVPFWLTEMDVDGFRMDVPNEVPFWFWKLFREKVKGIKPDAYLVGELWGSSPEWVGPETFDAVMNYKHFKEPVCSWIGQGRGSATTFERGLAPGRTAYPSQALAVQMNLIDSHDTVRFLTLADGDLRRLKMALLFTVTYPGVPHIWYGDEIGMTGGKDPDCRRPFEWRNAENPVREYYKRTVALRHKYAALRVGEFYLISAAGSDYAFVRSDGEETLLVVLHNSEEAGEVVLDLGDTPWAQGAFACSDRMDALEDGAYLTPRDGILTLPMAALSSRVLRYATGEELDGARPARGCRDND